MAITIHLPEAVEQALRKRAAQAGMTVEAFVVDILVRESNREMRHEGFYTRRPKSVACDVMEEAVPVLVEVQTARSSKPV